MSSAKYLYHYSCSDIPLEETINTQTILMYILIYSGPYEQILKWRDPKG